MLEVKDLYVGYYKDLNILQGVSITAHEAKITTVLGANGVGTSTLLKAVYGFLAPNSGEGLLEGQSILGIPTHKRIDKGISYIPQQPGIFRWMTVEENLETGFAPLPPRPRATTPWSLAASAFSSVGSCVWGKLRAMSNTQRQSTPNSARAWARPAFSPSTMACQGRPAYVTLVTMENVTSA